MKRIIFALLLALLGLAPASAQWRANDFGSPGFSPRAGCVPGTQAAAFFTRVAAASVTLDASHTTMYCNLINTLVGNGVFAKLDVLYFFATNAATGTASTLALLNLVQSNFNGTNHGATFTANQGFAGVSASTTVWIDSGFNPTTATSPNFTQNSAHVSFWSNGNSANLANVAIGQQDASSPTTQTDIYTEFSDNKAYFRINDPSSASAGVAVATQQGYYLATRTGASAQKGYINAVDQGIVSVTSAAPTNNTIAVLALHNGALIQAGSDLTSSAVTIGGALTPTDVTNLTNALAAARTAVGL